MTTPRSLILLLATLAVATPPTLASDAAKASASTAENRAGVSVVDDLGRSVTMPGPARRVAAASPAAVDLLLSIGVRPVTRPWMPGRTPDAWKGIPTIGFDHASGPNREQLLAAEPDLVVVDVTSARFIDRLEKTTGAAVFCLQVSDAMGLPETLDRLGRVTGAYDAAAQRGEQVLASIDRLRESAVSAAPPRVVTLFGGPRTGYVFQRSSYVGSLLEIVGAEPVLTGGEAHGAFPELVRYNTEQIWAADPDVIVVLSHGSVHDRLDRLRSDPAWSGLRAVREGRVHTLSDDLYVMRPGAEFLNAVAELRAAIEQR